MKTITRRLSVKEPNPLGSGWLPGPPPRISTATQAIDRAACAELRCPKCRKVGLDYRPFQLEERYKAVAECPECSFSEEV